MTIDEILSFLASRDLAMRRYERDGYDKFLKSRGFLPSFPYVHVTGTNGKGSTVNFLQNVYRAEGYKIASYMSPHFGNPLNAIQINGIPVSESRYVDEFLAFYDDFAKSDLSAFEMETIVAFSIIDKEKVDLAIIECGMGGEIDATNLNGFKPLLSIITTVSLEHTAFLGRTVSEIALSKSGIIKRGVPTLVGSLEKEALDVVRTIARKRESQLHEAGESLNVYREPPFTFFDYGPYKKLSLATAALYQVKNASLALEAISLLRTKYPLSELSIRKGLSMPSLSGRMETRGNVIFDGAHSVEAVKALMESVRLFAANRPIHALFASYRDKNIAVELPIISKDAVSVNLTTFDSPRARVEEDYFLYLADYPYIENPFAALSALEDEFPDDVILVTGSLDFAVMMAKRYGK